MKQKIVYIAGLGHSGSTILDLSLGAHPDMVGLGEVYTLLDKNRRQNHYVSYCSCGVKATECPFWGKAGKFLDTSEVIEVQYEQLIKYFRNNFGNSKILVDSSKNSYKYLQFLNLNYNLRVIFLVRDVRSWIYSRYLSTRKPLLYLAMRWYLENRKLLFQFRRMRINYFRVGYEELALYPEHLLSVISQYLDIGYHPDMLDLNSSKSHIISGNIARTDPLKKERFIYDARWLLSLRMFLISPLLVLLSRWNRKFVYSNIVEKNLKTFYLFGTTRKKAFSQRFN